MMAWIMLLFLQAVSGPGSVSGSVVDAGAVYRQPLFQARVELKSDSGSPMVLRTDPDGRFVFPNVVPGRYGLSVTCDGFLRKTTSVTVSAGQPLRDVVFALDAAPVIFGHVRDTDNIPVANIIVEGLRVVYGPRGDRSVVTAVSALTDDRGEYHLYWLDPGEYYIRASPLPGKPGFAIPGNVPLEFEGALYAPTYYPGGRDPKDANLIHVRVGSNFSAMDFKLQTGNFVSLQGIVAIEATGAPIGTTVSVVPAGATASSQTYRSRSLEENGGYVVGNMPPGTYVVSAEYSAGGQQVRAQRKVFLKVSQQNFRLQLSPGLSINGRIASESGPVLDLRKVRVALDSTDPDLASPPITSVGANGQFVSTPVDPGYYAIRLIDLPGDTYVKSAHSAGIDILSKPLRVGLAPIEPISIVLGLDGSRLEGIATDNANRPVQDADVVLVPNAARRLSPDQFRVTRSDGDGHFMLRGIAPGEYKLFAWERVEPNAYLSAVFMDGYELFGMPVTVPASSMGTMAIRVIPSD